MIKPATPSVSSSLALTAGAQAGAGSVEGDDAAASGDFAALLQSTLPPAQDGAASAARAADPAPAALLRQAAGNGTGKVLPLELPVAAAVAGRATPTTEAASASEIILPGLVIPISPRAQQAAPTETPVPAEQPSADALAQAAAVQAIRAKVPVATTATAPTAGPEKAKTTKADETTSTIDMTEDTAEPAITIPPLPTAAPDLMPIVASLPVPPQTTTQSTIEPPVPTTPARSATVTPPLPQAAQAQTPVARHTQRAQPAAETVAAAQPAEAPAAVAFTMNVAMPRTAAVAAAAAAAAPATVIQTAAPMQIKVETTEIKATPGTADVPQPALAPDARPFAQTAAPVETAPAGNPAPVQSGHDFATLVDRLVEARQAAMPEAVHAAVRHSEFGQVSLRFDQDANGLSVSMTSADPDFAKAVQASAASAQAQTQTQTGSDNGSNAPRQDGRQDSQQTQQQTGSAFGQSQTQSQAQSGTREDRARQAQTEIRSGRTADRQQQDDDAAGTRGGIYA